MTTNSMELSNGGPSEHAVRTTVRWSSSNADDRFTVENPATGEVIAIVQGGGTSEVDGAVLAAHQAFERDRRWRHPRSARASC